MSLYEAKEGNEIIEVDGIKLYLEEGVEDFPRNINIFIGDERLGGELTAKYL